MADQTSQIASLLGTLAQILHVFLSVLLSLWSCSACVCLLCSLAPLGNLQKASLVAFHGRNKLLDSFVRPTAHMRCDGLDVTAAASC